MRRLWTEEDGAFAVMFALLLVVIIGFSALAVDVGYWYASKRQLQTAADAAALAGCQDLAHEQSNGAIWTTVEDYAGRNFGRPLNLSNCSVVPPSADGMSDIGPNYVKVTVTSDSPAFLSRVLGREDVRIRAQSIARIGYVTGARSPAPWGLPLLRATAVAALAGGGAEHWLDKVSGDTWSGTLPAGSLGSVLIHAYNDQRLDPAYPNGVPEDAPGTGYLVRIPDGVPLAGISQGRLSGGSEHSGSVMFTSGTGQSVVVYVSLGAPLAEKQSLVVAHGGDTTMNKVTETLYRAQFAAPSTDDLQEAFTFDVEMKDGNKVIHAVRPAGGYVVRRSTFPIKDVRVSPSCSTSTSAGPAQVTVVLNDYQYGERYELKVTGGGAEVGNFMALDFHTLRHTPYWRNPQDPAEYPEMPNATGTYYEYVAGTATYDFVMHLGDAVWTQPGGLSGPTTKNSLLVRFAGEPSNFAGWVAAGKPPSNRLVLVPIVEKIQKTTGSTPLRVTSFATFYVEDVVSKGGDVAVSGLFVEYTAPSLDVVDNPPGPLAVEAVHLTAIGLDF